MRDVVRSIQRQMPDLEVSLELDSLIFRWSGGEVVLPTAAIRELSSRAERRRMIAEGESFIDLTSGTVHIHEQGAYLHLVLRQKRSHLTTIQCGLLAALCEEHRGRGGSWVIPSLVVQTTRYLEALTGARLASVSVGRFLRALRDEEVLEAREEKSHLLIEESKELLRRSFSLDRAGTLLRYPVRDRAQIPRIVEKLYPLCIGGLSEALQEHGGRLQDRDILVSRDALPQLRDELGPPMKEQPREQAPRHDLLLARVLSKAPLLVLAGKPSRRSLNPLLAAVEAMRHGGPLRTIGEELWKSIAP